MVLPKTIFEVLLSIHLIEKIVFKDIFSKQLHKYPTASRRIIESFLGVTHI